MHCGSTLLHCSYGLEAFFQELDLEYDPEECILRREVYASGKSRAFINDSPASLNQMKALGEKLIDVHSQHQNLLLNKEGFQLNILDILAQDEKQLEAYKQVYRHYKDISNTLEELIIQAEKAGKTKTICVSSWNNWKKPASILANKQNWSRRPKP